MTTVDNEIKQKISNKYYCKNCDYGTCRKSNMDSHLLSAKHQKTTTDNKLSLKDNEKSAILAKYYCKFCDKKYNDRAGLWRHNKKCINNKNYDDVEVNNEETNNEPDISKKDNLIQYLLKENSEFKNLIMELIKKDYINNTTNNTTNNVNSHNNSFSLNVFLNDTCKGAMNMSEFVDTITIQMSDLENFAHMDYANGVSKILLKNLNNLDTNQRPIHCTDLKRETVYIKENDCWTKEGDDKPNLKKAIKQIAFKNIKHINEWIKYNPGCRDPTTKQNVKYNKIVMNSMSGGTIQEQEDNIEKIVKNVSKAVTIDKYTEKII
jgi:hypothetical protein